MCPANVSALMSVILFWRICELWFSNRMIRFRSGQCAFSWWNRRWDMARNRHLPSAATATTFLSHWDRKERRLWSESIVAKLINSEVMHVEPSSRTIFVHVSLEWFWFMLHTCITLAVFTDFLHLSCAHLAEYSCCTCHLWYHLCWWRRGFTMGFVLPVCVCI